MAIRNEAHLIKQLLAGDDAAYRELIRQYHGTMRGLARRIVGEAIAEEVVQEAWISVIKALPDFRKKSSIKTWILIIVANEAKMRLRKEKRYVPLELFADGEDDNGSMFDSTGHWSVSPTSWHDNNPESVLSNEELLQCMEHLLTALPQNQQSVLKLRDQDAFSLNEICNILGTSQSNVRVLLHRARGRLYDCIDYFQINGSCKTERRKQAC